MSGLSPREIVELDEDEYLAFHEAVADREEQRSWSNTEELLATVVDVVNALRAEIRAGVPVVQVKRTREPEQPDYYPRPEWVEGSDEEADVIVMKPRDLARKMMRKGA